MALVLLVVIGGVAAWWFLRRPDAPPAATRGAASAPAVEPPAAAPPAPVERTIELPPLDASDTVLRQLVGRLSSNPQLVAWFANEDLARRFVAAVTNLAEGVSPAPHVGFLTPKESFATANDGLAVTLEPASYGRYAAATEAFASLDTAGTAQLYRELRPLFDEAYGELGYPGRSFDEAMAAAIDRLLAVRVPDSPPRLVPHGASGWAFADPELEALGSAEKHLLRIGPENARRAQAKLRELRAALGLPAPER
jgi:hypothetical protein